MARLTKREIEAICAVVSERVAGGTEAWKDATGKTWKEADRELIRADKGVAKLMQRLR